MSPLQILHLETDDADAGLVREELARDGIEGTILRVTTEEEFLQAIVRPDIDLVLADRFGSNGDALRPLTLAREKRPELPFIFVAGTLTPEEAIATLNAGANDFVLKDYLTKLGPAVRRAMREARAQRDLQNMRQELLHHAELLDMASDAIIICSAAGGITYWNRGAERIYGWKRDEAIGRNVDELLKTRAAETLGWLKETFRADDHWEGELWQTRKDGSEIVVASSWTLTDTKPNAPWLQINADVTDRVRAAEALRRSEERYRKFVDEDLTGNLIMKPDGAILTCNPAFVHIFGFDSVEEAQTANFMSLLRTKKEGLELFAAIRPNESVEHDELEMHQRDGDAVYVAARFTGTFTESGQLTELKGYLYNDTKRKRLERQLIQAQKMEGLGTLAGGIAHDFNNILAIILGYTTRIEDTRENPEQMADALHVIREAVERGAALVQQLLTSARQTEAQFASTDLNSLLSEMEHMLAATFPKTINFALHLQPDLPLAKADRSQIHQVLLNLCVNARDAMADGGTLTLETGTVRGAQLGEYFTGVAADNYVVMRVIDTGSGISKAVKPHIFEPFYTTKERSKGTGLGLSVVYGVVNNHRGFVQVDSEPGYGTTFSIYLPLESTPDSATWTGESAPFRPRERARTIMLVEDEEMLRGLGVLMLEGDGYRVLAAKDGVEAVEMFTEHADEIGLVLCDLGLPRLGGREVFMKMREIKPNVRAIVASGYMEPNLRSEILKAGVMDTVQKPYDFREMLAKIRSILGEPQKDDDQPQLF
ncbi:MAG TPA: response regulator [Chthoniobacterales bacterium]|jgi:PAS domain S-box-containing protein|nr:response regulator [Chthoniobacterales bacterium]